MNNRLPKPKSNKPNPDVQRAKYLARIIKSRRLQQNRTLEDVSQGVCSGSYLSKIENCSVDVEEVYYRALLEKVNIDYDSINFNYESKHLKKILYHFIHMNYKGVIEIASNIDNSEIFHEIECEIASVYINTYQQNYIKCDENIKRLEQLKNTMLDDEYGVYMIGQAFYLYQTHRLVAATSKLDELEQLGLVDNDFRLAIDHLLSMIHFSAGDYLSAYQYSQDVENNPNLIPNSYRLSANIIFRRLLNSKELSLEEIERYREIDLSGISEELKEFVQFHIYFAFYHSKLFLTSFQSTRESVLSSRIVALISVLHDKIDLGFTQSHIKEIVKAYNFTSTNSLFYHFVEAIKMKWKHTDPIEILTYLKEHFFSKFYEQYEDWLLKEALWLYFEVCNKAGKYKECCKLFADFLPYS